MKKILAFILATIMVLSLVPASSFAAFSAACPSIHTMLNCESDYVKTIPATCTSQGYDIYACVKCGAQIFDNFVAKIEHPWISGADKKHVDQAATCAAEGWKWVTKCSVCGATPDISKPEVAKCDESCGVEGCELYKITVVAEHNYQLTGNGIGCAVEYKCSACGEIRYMDKEGNYVTAPDHEWDYEKAEIAKNPTYSADGKVDAGQAVVYCKNCGIDKKVEITDIKCKHNVVSTEIKYADATCFAAGSKQVLKCDDCKLYYIDTNKNGKIDGTESNTKYQTLAKAKEAAAKNMGQLSHDPVPTTAAGFTSVENCVGTYKCSKCESVLTATFHKNSSDINADRIDVPATCTTNGYDFWFCNDCSRTFTKTVEKLGHDVKTATVTMTCANQGAKYTYCVRPNCDITTLTEVIDAKGDASFDSSVKKIDNIAGTGFIYYVRLTKNPENVVAIADSGHVITYTDITDKGNPITSSTPIEADCTNYKIVRTSCAYGCSTKNTVEIINAGSHSKYIFEQYSACTYPVVENYSVLGAEAKPYILNPFTKRTVYKCSKCSQIVEIKDEAVSSKVPTFNSEEELFFYHGSAKYVAKKDGNNWTTEYKENTTHSIVEGVVILDPTCTSTGLKQYICVDCGVNSYVVLSATKHQATEGVNPTATDYKGYKAATCTTTGTWGSFPCVYCKGIIVDYSANVAGYPAGQKVVTESGLVIKAHGSKLVKTAATAEHLTLCSAVNYWKCSDCDDATFTDYTATTPFDPTTALHTWKYIQEGVWATCTTPGNYEIRVCEACRYYEANALIIVNGTEYRVRVRYGTVSKTAADTGNIALRNKKADGTWENKTFKITKALGSTGTIKVTVPAFGHEYPLAGSGDFATAVKNKIGSNLGWEDLNVEATGKHETAAYISKQCGFCDHEYFTEFVPASGKCVNAAGEVINTDCSVAVDQDNFCIHCNADVEVTHTYDVTAANAHTINGTCSTDGYKYQVCKACGYINVTEVLGKNANYHTTTEFEKNHLVENGKPSDYAFVGTEYSAYCALCLKEIGNASDVAEIEEAGLEILLAADTTTIIPGSTVKVTVSLASLKGVNVWALAFPVTYDATVYEFVGYEWNTTDSSFPIFAVTDVAAGYEILETFYTNDYGKIPYSNGIIEKAGVLHIVANADVEATIKDEMTLVTLEFKVVSANGADTVFEIYDRVDDDSVLTGGVLGQKISVVYPEFEGAPFANGYTFVVMPTEKEIKVEVIDANGVEVKANYNKHNKTEIIEVADFLDLTPDNNTSEVTLADAYKLYSLIYNNEYDVRADANFDGKVDGRDLSILYAIYTGVITVEQLVTPNAELPEGYEAWMGAR